MTTLFIPGIGWGFLPSPLTLREGTPYVEIIYFRINMITFSFEFTFPTFPQSRLLKKNLTQHQN